MSKLGIIDIGSNSVRLIVSEIHPSGGFKILMDLKETLRIGLDVELNNKISDNKLKECLSTLKNFKLLCDTMGANNIITVATEAIRKASNNSMFINLVKDDVGLNIKVLSGTEEASLDAKSVINSLYIENSLVIDIGGSSTELAWVKDNKIIQCACLPFGSINLTHRYNIENIIDYKEEAKLKEFLIESMKDVPWLVTGNFKSIIGIGGSVRNLSRIDKIKKRYPIDSFHNYIFSDLDLSYMYNLLKSKSLKDRSRIEGLSKDRADIIVASTSILNTLAQNLNIKEIVVSGKGLREGLLYDYIEKNICCINDILEYSLESILENHNVDLVHAKNVYTHSKTLFNALKEKYNLNEDLLKILKIASYLHDVGISMRYYDHEKHSFYMILNSQISGVNHKELLMSAYTAAFHKKIKSTFCQYSSIINRLDIHYVELLGLILRISESFDKTLLGSITITDCSLTDDSFIIKVKSNKDISLEIKDALKCKDLFLELFHRDLVVEWDL